MKKMKVASIVLVLFLVAGCAMTQQEIQDGWNKLTPNEKARIIVGGFQDSAESLFDTGLAYVTANPQHKPAWQQKAVPAFDTANQAIMVAINLCAAGGATPDGVYKSIGPLIQTIVGILRLMGVDETKLKVEIDEKFIKEGWTYGSSRYFSIGNRSS